MTDNKIIHNLIEEELAEANKKHPLFTDSHHAYGVIKEEVEELAKAMNKGLEPEYVLDQYVWLVDLQGKDQVWKGFDGKLQQTQDAPYCVCQIHTEASWKAYQESLIPEETVPETIPGETIPGETVPDDPNAVG